MRSWISLAGLLIVVAALAAWLYYKPKPESKTTHALSTLKPAAVKRVQLERVSTATAPATSIALERVDDAWRVTAPWLARADTFQVERLLSILQAHSNVRYPATDVARFGLDRPIAMLTADDQTFAFGAFNNTTREQYVMTRNEVYLVAPAYGAALPRNADALLARQLFAPGEMPVRFDLPGFTVALGNGAWALSPTVPDLSADDRNAWVDAWRNASAMTVTRQDDATAAQSIKVTLKEGRTLTLSIIKREPELILLRADEGVQYLFVPEIAKRLMSPPGTPQVSDAVKK
ncbi:MAG TPA: DUF4340 domain-containing protein [Burkholderiales bacterium]|nr:DUF4340 domain-containing protein [Burkholderiales bacterium]